MAHLNAESLISHIEDIADIFGSQMCHIICISESFLKPTLPSNLAYIDGYTLVRNDRLGKPRGGVAMYVRKDLKFKVVYNSDPQYSVKTEILLVEVKMNSKPVLLGVFYRPPTTGFLNQVEEVLAEFVPRYEHFICLGDWNADWSLDRWDVNQLKFMFDSLNLEVVPSAPTCHVVNARVNSHTTLDLIVTSNIDRVANHGQFSVPFISIHDVIFASYSLRAPKFKPKFLEIRDFKNLNVENLVRVANELQWETVEQQATMEQKVDCFNDLLLGLYDSLAPVRNIRVTRPSSPWMSDAIINLRKIRDLKLRAWKRSGSDFDRSCYTSARNKLKQEIRNAKQRYLRTISGGLNLSSSWNKLKSMGIGKQSEDAEIDFDLNQLNSYFCALGGNLSQDEVAAAIETIARNSVPFAFDPFDIVPVDQQAVREAFVSIKSNASGSDGISRKMLQLILEPILPILTHIINSSIQLKCFPSSWKSAHVKPLPKTKAPTLPQHFRSVSLVPVLSKVLEKVVMTQMLTYLNDHALFGRFQSGFRQHHSTTTVMLNVTDSIRKGMDQRRVTILVLLDLSAAFNSVHWDILLAKLKYVHNFSPGTVSWFETYLKGRMQRVVDGGRYSGWQELEKSVPAGAVFGPALFSLYLTGFGDIMLPGVSYNCFADDIQLQLQCAPEDLAQGIQTMNNQLMRILDWSQTINLLLNPVKTQAIVLGSQRLLRTVDFHLLPPILIGASVIPLSETVVSLGLTVDQTLHWRQQTLITCKKVYGSLHSLYRMKNMLSQKTKAHLVQTLVFPMFDYCSVAMCDMKQEFKQKLQRCMNACVRFIFNVRKREHITPYYRELKWLKLPDRWRLQMALLLFKTIQSKSPPYLSDLLQPLSGSHDRVTRAGNKLKIAPHKTDFFSKSFAVGGARLWNSIPEGIRSMGSIGSFKAAYRRHLFENPQ